MPRHPPKVFAIAAPWTARYAWLAGWARMVAGVCLLAAASQARLPFIGTPVPFTLQPQAVLGVAALLGAHEALAAVTAWLVLGALGAPVFATQLPGAWALAGPTGGYLASYLPVAYVVGRYGRGHGPFAALVWLSAVAATLALGAMWLSQFIGAPAAWALGVMPFVATDVCKAGGLFLARRVVHEMRRRDR